MINYRKGKDVTEAEEIKKRLQEYTEELYREGLNDQDNKDGVVSHLEPDHRVWRQVGLRKYYYEQS